MNTRLYNTLLHYQSTYHPVVDFDADKDKLLRMDFTAANTALTDDILSYNKHFAWYIDKKLEGYTYGIGGYNEDRILYKRSKLFHPAGSQVSPPAGGGDLGEGGKSARSIHLGIDIWGPAGTKVYAPLGGMVHSFAYNNNFGDYGATIILLHQIETISFYTLYGHVSLSDLAAVQEGKYVNRGEVIGHFGDTAENGDWPPHLHFQIIEDLELKEGDYPGVCSKKEREKYLHNCPDPDVILNMMHKI